MNSLSVFGSQLTVLKALETPLDTILQLSYEPSPPNFTIRHIISRIASAKSPPFKVSIHKPPSIEELGRQMQRREKNELLLCFLVSVVVAIPTFIIGIVYMSLLKEGNSGKAFLMKPMWIGNASRSSWTLLFLATPVMFYSARVFHIRALKEIRVMWRKGSNVPLSHRFTRFGSMNLLVT